MKAVCVCVLVQMGECTESTMYIEYIRHKIKHKIKKARNKKHRDDGQNHIFCVHVCVDATMCLCSLSLLRTQTVQKIIANETETVRIKLKRQDLMGVRTAHRHNKIELLLAS